ncbi:MAG TPA: heme-binding domain-containing protein [Chitinophagaceae bacterium]|nr:heme-binding domain-containing protein [Chitinophagaceae bacterium]HPH30830.1 heme-binding domain-containing protein [Chitinophagaceae bacterium]HPN59988.1 heme-binding domain-containing protein [Chitinophagaceae bacterium]
MFKKIMLVLLAALVVIQFIHPKKNTSEGPQPNYIGNNYAVPTDVKSILVKACNDCHSNNTRYPWYAKIQPVDWWLNTHVLDGKKEINFDEFSNRAPRYQYRKMEEVIEMVKEREMPLKSYTWTHKDARLTSIEREKMTGWAQSVMDAMKVKYPVDSLIRPKR